MSRNQIKYEKVYLALIVVLSSILNFANIGVEGFSNAYYASGVKSMTQNFKNFFFVSMDTAGLVSIDKPPLGLWIQAISAKIFGYHGWSILLPQALAGVLSVMVLFFVVKRAFGSWAGLLSALFLAVTPVFVAVSRNNTVDNQLVLVLLLACWSFSMTMEPCSMEMGLREKDSMDKLFMKKGLIKKKFMGKRNSMKYFLLTMFFIGIGFNIKQLQAFMILPAIFLSYLLVTTISLKKRLLHLMLGSVLLVAVSLSWAFIVDATPEEKRPYVGSSTNNRVMELIFDHNGTNRLGLGTDSNSGMFGGGMPGGGTQDGGMFDGGMPEGGTQDGGMFDGGMPRGGMSDNEMPDQDNFKDRMKDKAVPDTGRKGGNGWDRQDGNNQLAGSFGAQTQSGITRLFSKNMLSDQIIWFLPLAFLSFVAIAFNLKLGLKLNTAKKQLVVVLFLWMFSEFIYFSYTTGLFHPHYLTMLAPPVAALSGIGVTQMWKMYKSGRYKAWALPISLLLTGAVQLLMLTYFYDTSQWILALMVVLFIGCFGSGFFLIVNIILKGRLQFMTKYLLVLSMVGILAAPLTGSAASTIFGVNAQNPAAGLELLSKQTTGNNGDGLDDTKQELIEYIENVEENGSIQLIVSSASTAENLIIHSDLVIGSLSGFMGNETVLSLERFKALVEDSTIQFVLSEENNRGKRSGNEILEWVKENGTIVEYTTNENSDVLYQLNSDK